MNITIAITIYIILHLHNEAGHLDFLRRYTFSAPSPSMLLRIHYDIKSAAALSSAHMKQKNKAVSYSSIQST